MKIWGASRQIINGEPFPIALETPFTIICCDCSLAHVYVLSSIEKDTVFLLRGYRDEFVTKDMRRRGRKNARKKAKITPQAIRGE